MERVLGASRGLGDVPSVSRAPTGILLGFSGSQASGLINVSVSTHGGMWSGALYAVEGGWSPLPYSSNRWGFVHLKKHLRTASPDSRARQYFHLNILHLTDEETEMQGSLGGWRLGPQARKPSHRALGVAIVSGPLWSRWHITS